MHGLGWPDGSAPAGWLPPWPCSGSRSCSGAGTAGLALDRVRARRHAVGLAARPRAPTRSGRRAALAASPHASRPEAPARRRGGGGRLRVSGRARLRARSRAGRAFPATGSGTGWSCSCCRSPSRCFRSGRSCPEAFAPGIGPLRLCAGRARRDGRRRVRVSLALDRAFRATPSSTGCSSSWLHSCCRWSWCRCSGSWLVADHGRGAGRPGQDRGLGSSGIEHRFASATGYVHNRVHDRDRTRPADSRATAEPPHGRGPSGRCSPAAWSSATRSSRRLTRVIRSQERLPLLRRRRRAARGGRLRARVRRAHGREARALRQRGLVGADLRADRRGRRARATR